MTIPVAIVGLGLGPEDLTAAQHRVVASAEVLVGGRRHLGYFPDHAGEKRVIDRDLDDLIAFIRDKMAAAAVVVLASGDPLFYGIGARLIRSLGSENVTVHPNVTAVAAAFARVKMAWEKAAVVSLHGRGHTGPLWRAMESHDLVAVFTDPTHSPAWVARQLIHRRQTHWLMAVLEQMGAPSEKVRWMELAAAAQSRCADPNLVILRREPSGPRPLVLGAPDEWYIHEHGLITKAEVRVISLSKLRLAPDQVLWDLGAGSGSVAIEAALFITNGRIVAMEKDPARAATIRSNAARFGVGNLTVIEGRAPDDLETLPRPDRVFIGGGGRHLGEIIRQAAGFLKPGGIMVVNTVLLANIAVAQQAMEALAMDVETIQVQIGRGQPMPWDQRVEALNPVWVISGQSAAAPSTVAIGNHSFANPTGQ